MKFGKPTSNKELESIDLSLPPDHPDTAKNLGKGKNPVKVYVGCAKWGRKEWVGLIYPEKTKDKDFLDHYVKNFNGIEMNTTFYSIKKENVENWASRAPEGFSFSPKFSRNISHLKRLNEDAKRFTDYFLDAAHAFGDKLGPSFLQMPDNFAPKYLDRLADYIKDIPGDFPMFVELRHTDWFTDPTAYDETFSMLEEYGRGAVITDVATRRDVVHQRLTSTKAFVRFNGYDFHPTDFTRLDEWVERIKTWIDSGLEELYFYAHQEDETNTPKTCDYIIEKLNYQCGLNLQRPNFQ
ncbi:DUF72 domain-containing protein [Fulvivirga ligni]|uniref:DUF72 domain-containing protein n=1 Tax=Fulvivirga ligni TaxID=2904246 RepID=UPI001F45A2ED|nr:DUF72 domain-containing protein [Fulvivirga ligni]UII19286.1 DUF72 domain-containing protein [Fulvivirga ligni]